MPADAADNKRKREDEDGDVRMKEDSPAPSSRNAQVQKDILELLQQ